MKLRHTSIETRTAGHSGHRIIFDLEGTTYEDAQDIVNLVMFTLSFSHKCQVTLSDDQITEIARAWKEELR